jgi:hypothetical protein
VLYPVSLRSQQTTSYGVRVDFCEPGGSWSADNQGYFKYLELWPNRPEADEATWMGPMGNASFCGDSEGSAEELKEFIAQALRAKVPDQPLRRAGKTTHNGSASAT